jgi:hypothetical protein
MSKFKSILRTLNSTNVVLGSGFMLGFVHEIKFKESTLRAPLSTLFSASTLGFLTYCGSAIVHDLIPPQLRFLIPVMTAMSCVYYKIKDLRHKHLD